MATISVSDVLKTLRSQRARARKEVRKLEKAIAVLRGLSANPRPSRARKRRRMSAAARRKIGAAQRKRWAKFHQQRVAKG